MIDVYGCFILIFKFYGDWWIVKVKEIYLDFVDFIVFKFILIGGCVEGCLMGKLLVFKYGKDLMGIISLRVI